MAIEPLPDLLDAARRGGYAVGYFEAWDVYSMEAVVAAAEAERSPAIIGLGGLSADHGWLQAGGIEVHGRMAEILARRASVPLATMWNEAESFAEAAAGLTCGFNAVMIHTHGWEADRVETETRALVAAAHGVGVAVEGEVGELAEMHDGKIDDQAASSTPEEAAAFVAATGVDALSVAVGNVHFVTAGDAPDLQLDNVPDFCEAVDVPLVLHGGSGATHEQLRAAVEAGFAKVNVATRLKTAFGTGVRAALDAGGDDPNLLWGSRMDGDVCSRGGAAIVDDVRGLMQALNSSGKVAR